MNINDTFLPLIAATVFTLGPTGAALAYDPPPSWMPMTMLPIKYDSANHRLTVADWHDQLSVAPVLTIRPSGTYDPAQPWGVLNATATSRRFGWYDGVADDFYASFTLPAGASVWIEKINASPEIKSYQVLETDNPTGPYTPIFGTAGSSVKWRWDGKMDHNTYAVDLSDLTMPNQPFFATYTLYLGDSLGTALDGYESATTTWNWTGPATVPEPASLGLLAAGSLFLIGRQRRNA